MKKILEFLSIMLLKLVSLVLRAIAYIIDNIEYVLIITAIHSVWADKNYLFGIFTLLLVCAMSVVRIAKTDIQVKVNGKELLSIINKEERKGNILN